MLSLKKCPPIAILQKLTISPKIIFIKKKIGFLIIIIPVINEKAAEDSPLIHEQFFHIDLI